MNEELELLETIEHISDTVFAAGWMLDIEYRLWAHLVGDNRHPGLEYKGLERRLILCSEGAGGWWYWNGYGPAWVSVDVWEAMYNDWRRHHDLRR